MSGAVLPPEALEMLRSIHRRGLYVLMRYRIAYPTWEDNGDDLESAEERLFNTLYQLEAREKVVDGERFHYRAWVSLYLNKEPVRRSAEIEEFDGLLYHYTLTAYALQLIGERSETKL